VQPVSPELPIHSQTLVLHPILPVHAALLFEDLQATELYTFIPSNPPRSREELLEKYRRWAGRQSADGSEIWLNYAIYHLERSEYVGTVQATLERSGKASIAYEVFPRYWRRGFAREACTALIAHIFDSYDIRIISALVDTRNEMSWKLLESLGFHRTATIKNADTFKGIISDEYAYELHTTAANAIILALRSS